MHRDQNHSHYAVSIPARRLNDQQFYQLLRVIAENSALLKTAFGADTLPVVWLGRDLWFPWFTFTGTSGEEVMYQRLISQLCRRADQIPRRKGPAVVTRLAMWRFLAELGFTEAREQMLFKFLFENFEHSSSAK